MTKPTPRKVRCAIYTRKSSEEGLDQEFNSLHAQREACEAYIASQRSEGWVVLREQYDDGGISGGTLERPGLQQLLADIDDGLVDVVVVYKIDRLSRSLMDFSKLVEAFERNNVTFVSVTQSFNTTTSMGRLTLNILLSFAQFEREVTAERIRDKVAASKKKGMWMGGVPPYGYAAIDRRLEINESQASHVLWIFDRFINLGSTLLVAQEAARLGLLTPKGKAMDIKFIYRILTNPIYIGKIAHKDEIYPGLHNPIVDMEIWEKARTIISENRYVRSAGTRRKTPSLLAGLIRGPDGAVFSSTHSRRRNRLYRYYVSQTILKQGAGTCPVGRIPAGEIEASVTSQLRAVFRQPEIVAEAWRNAAHDPRAGSEQDIHAALKGLDPIWDELFPAEQARITTLLIDHIDVSETELKLHLRVDGLRELARDLKSPTNLRKDAV